MAELDVGWTALPRSTKCRAEARRILPEHRRWRNASNRGRAGSDWTTPSPTMIFADDAW